MPTMPKLAFLILFMVLLSFMLAACGDTPTPIVIVVTATPAPVTPTIPVATPTSQPQIAASPTLDIKTANQEADNKYHTAVAQVDATNTAMAAQNSKPIATVPVIQPTAIPPTIAPTSPAETFQKFNSANVISAFKSAGLEAEQTSVMTPKDYGLAPLVAVEGTHFIVPSLCSDCGGRVLSFANQDDLSKTKAYYDNLSKQSAAFFSWVFVKDNILVQINGTLPEAKAKQYQSALDNLP